MYDEDVSAFHEESPLGNEDVPSTQQSEEDPVGKIQAFKTKIFCFANCEVVFGTSMVIQEVSFANPGKRNQGGCLGNILYTW